MSCAIMAGTLCPSVHAGESAETRADSLAALARDAARRHDNAAARIWFQAALEAAPERRSEWLRELADQALWSGHAAMAVPLYREVLTQGAPSRADFRQVRLNLALALSWNGQLDASLCEYEALLLEDPIDLHALLGRGNVLSWLDRNAAAQRSYVELVGFDPSHLEGHRQLGRVLSWRGRQRQAQEHLLGVLAAYPDDDETILLLARAQWWLGRSDRALVTLRAHLQSAPEDTKASALLHEFNRALRHVTRLEQQGSRQSDDLEIDSSQFAQDFVLGGGRTTLGPRYQLQRYEPKSGSRILVHRPGAYARHRFTDGFEWNALVFVDWIDLPSPATTHVRFTYSTWATLWPNDFARFDIGSDRTILDNVASLHQNIVATAFNLSSDILPDERSRFVARASWADYTDGNGRLWGQVEGERRLLSESRLWAGARSTAFHFREVLDHGYFNPRDYVAVDATLRVFAVGERALRYDGQASAGYEHASPGGSKFIWSAGLQVDFAASRHIELGAQLGHFSSATASSSGFARTTFGVDLRFPW